MLGKKSCYFEFGSDDGSKVSSVRRSIVLKLNTSRSVSWSWDGCLALVLVLALESSHQWGLWHFLWIPERHPKVRLLHNLPVLGKTL